jgi:hypothetical protein
VTAPGTVETTAPVPAEPATVIDAVDPVRELAVGAAAEPVGTPPAAPAPAAGDPAPVVVRSSRRSPWLAVGIVLAVIGAAVLVYSINEGQRHEAPR